MKRFFFLVALLPAGCASPSGDIPSLAPRAAEAIDPRVPVPDRSGEIAADPALAASAGGLLDRARAASARFDAAMSRAEQLAARAGSPQSDSWIAAQQALSAAIAERGPVTMALADADGLIRRQIQERGGLTPNDLANVQGAAEDIAAMDRAQAARVDAVQARLRT